MPGITGEIGLDEADLPAPSTLCKSFDRIEMRVCRVLLRQSVQLKDPSEHAAIDATFDERNRASRHYCHRTNYRVQTLKVTKLVDTATQAVVDLCLDRSVDHPLFIVYRFTVSPVDDPDKLTPAVRTHTVFIFELGTALNTSTDGIVSERTTRQAEEELAQFFE